MPRKIDDEKIVPQIREMCQAGATSADICAAVGICQPILSQIKARYGLISGSVYRQRFTDAFLKRHIPNGWLTPEQAAKVLGNGYDRNYIYSRCHVLGIRSRTTRKDCLYKRGKHWYVWCADTGVNEYFIEYIWRHETGLEKPEGKHLYPLDGNFDSVDINDWIWLSHGEATAVSKLNNSGDDAITKNLIKVLDVRTREAQGILKPRREHKKKVRERKKLNESKGISVTDQD